MADVSVNAYEADLTGNITQAQVPPFNITVSTLLTLYGGPAPTQGTFYASIGTTVRREVVALTREGAPAGQLRVTSRALGGTIALAHDAADPLVKVRSVFATDAPDGTLVSPSDLSAYQLRSERDQAGGYASKAALDTHTHGYGTLTGLPDLSALPTAGQKGALIGTGGTPSAANEYVTRQGLQPALDAKADDSDIAALDARVDTLEAAPAGGADPWTHTKLTVDATRTAITLADLTGLGFAVAANTTYEFEWLLAFQSVALTTGLVLALAGPAASMAAYRIEVPISATTVVARHTNAFAIEVIGTGVDVINVPRMAQIRGLARFTAAGTLIPRFRSEVNASEVRVLAGSLGNLRVVV